MKYPKKAYLSIVFFTILPFLIFRQVSTDPDKKTPIDDTRIINNQVNIDKDPGPKKNDVDLKKERADKKKPNTLEKKQMPDNKINPEEKKDQTKTENGEKLNKKPEDYSTLRKVLYHLLKLFIRKLVN